MTRSVPVRSMTWSTPCSPLRRGPPIGDGLADEALAALAASMAAAGPLVANPTARDRSGLVEVVVTATGGPSPDVQVLSERAGLPGSITLDGETVRNMLGLIQGSRIDNDTYVTDVTLAEDDTGLDITIVHRHRARDGVPVEEIKRELFTRLTARPDTEVATQTRPATGPPDPGPPGARCPGSGGPGSPPPHSPTRRRSTATATGAVSLDNGLVTVAIDPADGTFSINGTPGLRAAGRRAATTGTPTTTPPRRSTRWSTPRLGRVAAGDRGPVRATRHHHLHLHLARPGGRVHQVEGGQPPGGRVTTLEVRADEPVLRVRTRFDNPSRDHRVRAHLPLPEPASTSQAECAFAIVERGLDGRGPRPTSSAHPPSPPAGSSPAGGLDRGPRRPSRVRAGRPRGRRRR